MAVDYDAAFESVVQQPWNDLPQEQQDAAALSQPGGHRRRGQLSPEAPDACALHDTFHYQRGHADVFREAYKAAPHVPPTKGQSLRVVDIGAGAATVAVAIAEALGRKTRQRIDYLAFDPNPMMQDLGERVLKRLDAGFKSAAYVESLDTLNFTSSDRLLFTFSYVSHQQAVLPADVNQWATLIDRAVSRSDRAVELIYTTAANLDHKIEPRLHALRKKFTDGGLVPSRDLIAVQIPQRYPDPETSTGRVRWRERDVPWQVVAERWTLRA